MVNFERVLFIYKYYFLFEYTIVNTMFYEEITQESKQLTVQAIEAQVANFEQK